MGLNGTFNHRGILRSKIFMGYKLEVFEARKGIEPSHRGFADPRVSSSPPRHVRLSLSKFEAKSQYLLHNHSPSR